MLNSMLTIPIKRSIRPTLQSASRVHRSASGSPHYSPYYSISLNPLSWSHFSILRIQNNKTRSDDKAFLSIDFHSLKIRINLKKKKNISVHLVTILLQPTEKPNHVRSTIGLVIWWKTFKTGRETSSWGMGINLVYRILGYYRLRYPHAHLQTWSIVSHTSIIRLYFYF